MSKINRLFINKTDRLLFLLVLLKLVIPWFLQDASFQPHRDEYLYLAEGRHLAWGYMEVPPLLSCFAALTDAAGGGLFWIKIWPVLFGAFTFLLVGKIVLSLGGGVYALVLGWLPFVLDGYLRLFFLFQPNFLEVFFWTAIGYCVIRFIQTGRTVWLYGFGLCVGLGMMSKYSVVFLYGQPDGRPADLAAPEGISEPAFLLCFGTWAVDLSAQSSLAV